MAKIAVTLLPNGTYRVTFNTDKGDLVIEAPTADEALDLLMKKLAEIDRARTRRQI